MTYQGIEQRRIIAGFCKDCGVERGESGTTVFCRACANRRNQRAYTRRERSRQQWRAGGDCVCNGCGGQLPDAAFKRCFACRSYARTHYATSAPSRKARKQALGTCVVCRKPALRPSRYCQQHFLENILRKRRIPSGDYDSFWAKLEAQHFLCFYTGIELVPGRNASLDHRIPTSRGGSPTDPENCVWCDRLVNAFKNDLTEDEFIERCRIVVALASKREPSLAVTGRRNLGVARSTKRQPTHQGAGHAVT